MPTITKRGEFQWRAQVRKKGAPPETRTFTSRADAALWAAEREREIRMGIYMPRREGETTTLDDLADDFEKYFAPHHYRGHAWRHKLKPLRAALGKYALVAITGPVVAKYRDQRLTTPDPRYKEPARAPRISGSTVKSELDMLSKLIGYAEKERGIVLPGGNPVSKVRKPSMGKGRDRRLVGDEAARLLEQCEASSCAYLTPAVLLSLETAMRQGELLALRWADVDHDRGLALLLDPDKIKTAEPRAVPLTPAALRVLKKLPRSIDGRVFPVDRQSLYGAFKRACGRAGIKDFTWHDLRHEALSRLAERGDLSVLELAAVSGHKQLQMLKRYTHLQAEKLARKLARSPRG